MPSLGLARSSKLSIRIEHGTVGLWVYAGVCGFTRTPWSERRARSTFTSLHSKIIILRCSIPEVETDLTVAWPCFSVILGTESDWSSVVKWQTSLESGGAQASDSPRFISTAELNRASWRFPEKTSQVSCIGGRFAFLLLCSMRPTQELAQSTLFTLPSEGFSISDRTKLSYERARAIGRAYGS
jgi:hypothetical protein